MIQSSNLLPTISRNPYIWPTYSHHPLLSPLTFHPSHQGGAAAPPMVSMISRNADMAKAESTDPDVRMAYRSVSQHGALDWLVLTYGKSCLQWSPGLKLFAAGSQGLTELKQRIAQSAHSVFFAFCRLSVNETSRFATITYIPEGTSGLRKARSSAASRTVQSWFKGPQATLTISRLEELTLDAILEAMPPSPATPTPTRTILIKRASSEIQTHEKALPRAPEPVTRTASEPVTYLSLRGPPNFGDPRTRSEQRDAARKAAEAEARRNQYEEQARQARIKQHREEEARRAEEEEIERRAQLERDLERKAAARMAQEEADRVEEERRERERMERRLRDAEKRAEVARRLEEWRLEEARKIEKIAKAEEELKQRAIERREAARVAAGKRRRESRLSGDSLLLTGWVTVQNSGSVAWRRRYFQLTDTLMRFYNREKVGETLFHLLERQGSLKKE
ncbi:hypothetical protein B0F90DRAFT_1751124 [Multifurca ochricompacta]|uniref:PH domain-containing protein n=1 Tax=Multifurca ochricompacta TaxID=376703 RepID=A0AAD4LYQ3_9AGAM|nr:hypothetical protein B0F90DRAFT_1751124 [Multifurca ochricompacta]